MLFLASLVMSKVIVTLPLPLDSAFDTGGFSLAGRSVAVNVGLVGEVGVAGELLQPTAMSESATLTIDSRFMHPTPSCKSKS
jgi:hypothetical protein